MTSFAVAAIAGVLLVLLGLQAKTDYRNLQDEGKTGQVLGDKAYADATGDAWGGDSDDGSFDNWAFGDGDDDGGDDGEP